MYTSLNVESSVYELYPGMRELYRKTNSLVPGSEGPHVPGTIQEMQYCFSYLLRNAYVLALLIIRSAYMSSICS